MLRSLNRRKVAISTGLSVIGLTILLAFNNCTNGKFDASTTAVNLAMALGVKIDGGKAYTNQPIVTLNLQLQGGDQMYMTADPTCKTGGVWEPMVESKAWTLPFHNAENKIYLQFRNSDSEGSDTACIEGAIIHDDILPVISVTQAVPPFINTMKAALTFASQDAGSGVSETFCSTSNSTPIKCTGTYESPTIDEGNHQIMVESKDRAGNLSLPLIVNFVVDRTAPSILVSSAPPSLTNQQIVTFLYAGSDGLSGVLRNECKLDSATAFTPCGETLTTPSLAEGTHKLEVRSVDRAGNLSTSSVHSWSVDLTAPTVTVPTPPKAFTNLTSASIAFSGTDRGMAISSFECSLDEGAFAVCTSPFETPALAEGPHQFAVRGTDVAGNTSQPKIVQWVIDLTPPTVTLVQAPPSVVQVNYASVTFAASDALSGIDHNECYLDGANLVRCSGPSMNYQIRDNGVHWISVIAFDKAGNSSPELVVNFSADMPPYLKYPNPVKLKKGVPAGNIVPVRTGGELDHVDYTPALPPGLTMNLATGVISGTPTTKSRNNSYPVRAFGPDGRLSVDYLNIEVEDGCELNITGNGSEATPYLIKTVDDIYCVDKFPTGKSWALDVNLTIEPADAVRFDSGPYVIGYMSNAKFDGRNHEIIYNVDCTKQNCDRATTKNDIALIGGLDNSTVKNLSLKYNFKNIDISGRRTFTQYVCGVAISSSNTTFSRVSSSGYVMPSSNGYPQMTSAFTGAFGQGLTFDQVYAKLEGPTYGLVAPIMAWKFANGGTTNNTGTTITNSYVEGDMGPMSYYGAEFGMLATSPNANQNGPFLSITNSYYSGNYVGSSYNCGSGVIRTSPPGVETTVTLSGFFYTGSAVCRDGTAYPLAPIDPSKIPTVLDDLNWDKTLWETGTNGLPALKWMKNIIH